MKLKLTKICCGTAAACLLLLLQKHLLHFRRLVSSSLSIFPFLFIVVSTDWRCLSLENQITIFQLLPQRTFAAAAEKKVKIEE